MLLEMWTKVTSVPLEWNQGSEYQSWSIEAKWTSDPKKLWWGRGARGKGWGGIQYFPVHFALLHLFRMFEAELIQYEMAKLFHVYVVYVCLFVSGACIHILSSSFSHTVLTHKIFLYKLFSSVSFSIYFLPIMPSFLPVFVLSLPATVENRSIFKTFI